MVGQEGRAGATLTDLPPTTPLDPGLYVYRSNRTEYLAEVLAAVIGEEPLGDPFEPEQVVIGNRGMERWLSHFLAERHGVCAQVAFPFTQAALARERDRALEDHPAAGARLDPWSPEVLTWALAEELPELLRDPHPDLDPLRGALAESSLLSTGELDRRARALCAELATVLDRLISWRPELVLSWSDGHREKLDIPWIRPLWDRLHARFSLTGIAEHAAHRNRLAQAAWAAGKRPGVQRLHLFGLSGLPPLLLDELAELSRQIPIHLYLLVPSDLWWADLHARFSKVGAHNLRLAARENLPELLGESETSSLHPLLQSLGRVARDLQLLLESLPENLQDRTEVAAVRHDLFQDPLTATPSPQLLHYLQSDLFWARHPETDLPGAPSAFAQRPPMAREDRSIELHCAHGLLRQVEVLRDRLLQLFAEDPSLEPRDVVVLCADIEAAAPLIEAVFGGARQVPAPIPFRVADLGLRRLNPVADALLRVLELATGRAPASALLDLLALEPVSRRFSLSPDGLQDLSQALQEAGVRWGQDADHRARHEGLPPDHPFTWRFGLDRLLLGALLPAEPEAGYLGVQPWDPIQGQTAEQLGNLTSALATVFAALETCAAARPVGEFATLLENLIEPLTAMDDEGGWLTRRVREDLQALVAESLRAGSVRPIRPEALLACLAARMDVAATPTALHTGAVTFCALQPMRSVPYRVVALLGMDEGAFPRQDTRLGFDLCALLPRPGDKSPRDEDRHLFLESILAARERLLFFTTARDLRTNEARAPAVPLAELLDVLDRTLPPPEGSPLLGSVREAITHTHTLQPFDPRNFLPLWPSQAAPEARQPWSFDPRWLKGARVLAGGSSLPIPPVLPQADLLPEGTPEEWELSELRDLLLNAPRTFLRRRMGVRFSEAADPIADREPLELDALAAWQLQTFTLQATLGNPLPDPHALFTHLEAHAVLPPGTTGKAAFEDALSLTESLCAEAHTLLTGSPQQASFGRTGPGATLQSSTFFLDFPDVAPAVLSPGLPPEPGRTLRLRTRIPVLGPQARGGHLALILSPGRENPKRMLEAWLLHLAMRASGATDTRVALLLAHYEKNSIKAERFAFRAIGPAEARTQLGALLSLALRAARRPLPLFPAASPAFAKKYDPLDPDSMDAAQGAAGAGWFGGFQAQGDREDPYIIRLYPDSPPGQPPHLDPNLFPLFSELALQVWAPLYAARLTTKDVQTDKDGAW